MPTPLFEGDAFYVPPVGSEHSRSRARVVKCITDGGGSLSKTHAKGAVAVVPKGTKPAGAGPPFYDWDYVLDSHANRSRLELEKYAIVHKPKGKRKGHGTKNPYTVGDDILLIKWVYENGESRESFTAMFKANVCPGHGMVRGAMLLSRFCGTFLVFMGLIEKCGTNRESVTLQESLRGRYRNYASKNTALVERVLAELGATNNDGADDVGPLTQAPDADSADEVASDEDAAANSKDDVQAQRAARPEHSSDEPARARDNDSDDDDLIRQLNQAVSDTQGSAMRCNCARHTLRFAVCVRQAAKIAASRSPSKSSPKRVRAAPASSRKSAAKRKKSDDSDVAAQVKMALAALCQRHGCGVDVAVHALIVCGGNGAIADRYLGGDTAVKTWTPYEDKLLSDDQRASREYQQMVAECGISAIEERRKFLAVSE
eukprot:SAG31_NODE_237_length_19590_cov_13.149915_14_plen_430_part_00